ncbi:MAG: undecaprenyl-diphosphate phosphatase [Luteolibacter sp.]|uniref:undecaprenyl-diphosphate phosphatase n=1 Tax=Luteolibacter sp. TaxID=1962973 RepID=UPI0032662E64
MHPWQAFILGVIEGITEYLPISSTGHLIVAQRLMGIGTGGLQAKEAADAFAVCIQGGAILAVLGLYWKRVIQMIQGVLGKNPEGLKLAINIIAGFLPAAVIGVILSHKIKEHLFGLWPVVIAWFIGGVGILAVSWWRKSNPPRSGGVELAGLTLKMALIIGLLQCVAMCPGTSRSLMTICGGLLVGLSIRAAVEYSFLLGVLTLTAATAKDAVGKVKGLDPMYDKLFGGTKLMLNEYGAVPMIIGIVAAAISAAIAVKWLVSYLQSHGLSVFGWYRIGIGLIIGSLIVAGTLQA